MPKSSLLNKSNTRWNDKTVVRKKTTLQLYFKTFIEKINSGNVVELTSIQCSRLQPQSPPRYGSGTGSLPFPQAPAGARRILGGWRWSGLLWCCGRSCWWCSRRMTKQSSPAGSGRERRGRVREGYKVAALLLKPSLGFFGLWADADCCHTQGLPPASWLHQAITTLFSTPRYTFVLTFKPTSKMWGGMMWLSLETTPKTITVAGNFVFITLGTSLLFVAIQICILRVLAMVLLS